ncbi:lipopolysaccharide biosynthesis protein [Halodesulfovibrio sp. MK-HDV]|uniref:lipopolysaccharide biosynthesis protein n=1 Tax=Halodesulfovibrio sp. MK-HDV TaxID=2599925 RepID=UPI001371FBF5|nr:oligosaccharide flippase family protein [Halodesulfovibrio sp. MK-HDV]
MRGKMLLPNLENNLLNLFKKNDSHFSVVLRGSAYALFAKILIIAFGFLNNILVARYYGAELIGILSIVQTLLTLLSLLALIGFNQSVLAIIPKESIESRYFPFPFIVKVAAFVISTSFVLSCLTYLGLNVWEVLEQKIQLETAIQVGSFFIVIYALRALFLSFFRAIGAIKLFTILQLVTPISNFCILLIIIIYSFSGLWVVLCAFDFCCYCFSCSPAVLFVFISSGTS